MVVLVEEVCTLRKLSFLILKTMWKHNFHAWVTAFLVTTNKLRISTDQNMWQYEINSGSFQKNETLLLV